MEKQSVVFDTETTGLIKPEIMDLDKQPEIIELYMAKFVHRADGVIEQIDEFETYLKPKGEISDLITRITGITPAKVADAPTFAEVFPQLQMFHVGVHEWVAHNCAFDTAMMANEISRIGKVIHFPFPPKKICTVQKTMHIEQRRMTLTNLHKELFGVEFAEAHRAKGDVTALIKCWKECIVRGWIK